MRLSLLLSSIALTLTNSAAADWQHEVLFTKPSCPTQRFTSVRLPEVSDTYKLLLEEEALLDNADEILLAFDELPRTSIEGAIATLGGEPRDTIPAGVFCDDEDREASLVRASESSTRDTDSPYLRVFDWMDTVKPKDKVFVTSMSFSSREFATALCEKAQTGTEVKLFIHEPRRENTAYGIVSDCRLDSNEQAIELIEYPSDRGRLAHMKAIVIDYQDLTHSEDLRDRVRYTFQSANLSTSGLWAHHENWNFITSTRDHWLAKDHLCLRDSVNDFTMTNLNRFYEAMTECREERGINTDRAQDNEIAAYFTPIFSREGYNDRRALRDMLNDELSRANKVQIAVHHLTDRELMDRLSLGLRNDEFSVELLLDDDLFWTAYSDFEEPFVDSNGRRYFQPIDYSRRCDWGKTREEAEDCFTIFRRNEYQDINEKLIREGATVKYVEANHLGFKLFHHKFMIVHYDRPYKGYDKSVFTGAGNFSRSGFERNFENYFLVRRPDFVKVFDENFVRLWDLAASKNELPISWDFTTTDILQ